MEVSINGGTLSHHPFLDGIFPYKPSILGVPPWLWKAPWAQVTGNGQKPQPMFQKCPVMWQIPGLPWAAKFGIAGSWASNEGPKARHVRLYYLYCHWPSTKRIALCNQTVMHGCSLRFAKWFVTGVPNLLKLLLTALSWETVPNRKQNTKLETSSDLFQFNIVQLLLTQSSKVVLSCRDTPIKKYHWRGCYGMLFLFHLRFISVSHLGMISCG